jgi:hypothetical protein
VSTRETAHRVLVALGAAAVMGGTLLALGESSRLRATWPAEADTFYLPSARAMRIASLGHHELTADLVAARANVYFGTQIMNQGQQRYLADYLVRAVDLDPFFHRLYLSGAAMEIYNGQTTDVPTMLGAVALLERGTTAFPFDWEMMFQLGFNYLFELPRLAGDDDARAPHWRQRGVELLRQAALFEGTPDWLPNLVARMLTRKGSDEMAVRHLEQAYAVAASDEARVQIRAKLTQLRGRQITSQLEEEQRRYEARIAARYPYAPDAFSVIAGARQPDAVDLQALAVPPGGLATQAVAPAGERPQ